MCLAGCSKKRVPTDPDYVAEDVRRPGVEHRVPVGTATDVPRNTTVTIWFDELMNEASVIENFWMWSSITIGSTPVIAIDQNNPGIIYTATAGKGIFKSEDGAESWFWLTPLTMQMVLTDLVVSRNSNLLYAATSDSGIYRSLDAGATWQQISNGLPEMNVLALAVDPTNEDIIYAAMNSTGIYKSDNGGVSWSAKNNGVNPSRGPRNIVINPLDSHTLYAATQGDFILKSMNGGESWTRLRTGLFTFNFNTLAIHPQDTALVFAGSDGGGMYKTENGGSNWTMMNSGLTNLEIQSIVLHPQNISTVVISTGGGIFQSFDAGQSWLATGNIPPSTTLSMLVSNPLVPERIYAATSSGIYRSDDQGNLWATRNNLPIENLRIEGSYHFETWQDSTVVIAPLNPTTMDTTILFPYIYDRALVVWEAGGRQGEPPVDPNPPATKMVFTPTELLRAVTKYQVRVLGTFEDDRETFQEYNRYGAEDIHGNSFETNWNSTFTTGDE